jgi:ribosomal protein S27AE
MPDGDSTAVDREADDVAPHEAFAILADPNRFDLVRVLAEASRQSLPFSELYRRSNFEDSGQFNYHLERLVGPFLRRTEDGYGLRHAALIVHRLAASGLLSDRGEAEVTTVETTCPRCGAGRAAAVYEGDRFWVRCGGCGRRAAVAPFPPRALRNHEPERAPAAFDRYTTGLVVRAAENVCPWCASPLSASLEPATDDWPAVDWTIHRECDHCRGWIHTRVHDLLRLHPAVVAFYHERGVDVLGSSIWEVEEVMTEGTRVVADADAHARADEWTAVVTLVHDGDAIELGIADDLRVSTTTVLETESS